MQPLGNIYGELSRKSALTGKLCPALQTISQFDDLTALCLLYLRVLIGIGVQGLVILSDFPRILSEFFLFLIKHHHIPNK